MIWARKKTGVPVIRISTLTEAEEFLKKHQMFVVGLFEKFEVCDFQSFYRSCQNMVISYIVKLDFGF